MKAGMDLFVLTKNNETWLYTKSKLAKFSFPPLAGGIEGGGQGDKIDIIPST